MAAKLTAFEEDYGGQEVQRRIAAILAAYVAPYPRFNDKAGPG